jgi:hypothetical protein
MEFGDQQFTDNDLRDVFNRALRTVIIALLIGIPITWFAWGWRSMLLFVVGGVIAATGILEWRQLMAAILVRLDTASTRGGPRPVGPVVFWFFVRLVAAAGLLYVSLRSLDGKVAALILGIALAVAALLLEALRLFRGWSA